MYTFGLGGMVFDDLGSLLVDVEYPESTRFLQLTSVNYLPGNLDVNEHQPYIGECRLHTSAVFKAITCVLQSPGYRKGQRGSYFDKRFLFSCTRCYKLLWVYPIWCFAIKSHKFTKKPSTISQASISETYQM